MDLYYKGDYKAFERQRKNLIREAEKYSVSIQVDNVKVNSQF